MALRGRRIDNFIDLWSLVGSGGVDIWVSSTSSQKSDIGWPQQPLTEKVQISVKIWSFDDPLLKKEPVLVILMQGVIQSSEAVIFLMKWGCKGHWGHGGCWGCRGHWGRRGLKAWKITTLEDFRVIQVLKFSFILMFWKKNNLLVEWWNILLNFRTFSVGGCWCQPMLFFWKLVDKTQMSTPPEPTRDHKSMKLLIFLPLRAFYFSTFQYETPCSSK